MVDVAKMKKKMGKSSPVSNYKLYDPDTVVPYVFEQLAEGRTLTDICEQDETVPSVFHTLRLINSKESWSQSYKMVRELRAEVEFENMLKIVDELPPDWKTAKVKIDTRKWWIEKAMQKSLAKEDDSKSQKNRLIGIDLTPEALEKLQQIAEEMDEGGDGDN